MVLVHSVVGPGDAELLRALVRGGEQATDPTGHGVLRERRIGEAPELLEARLSMLQTEATGGLQVLGHVLAEDLQGALDSLARGDRGPRGPAQVRVVEVRQSMRGRLQIGRAHV